MAGRALLHSVAASGNVEGVATLAASYPQLVNAKHGKVHGRTPLFVAAERGHAGVVETLHRLGAALDPIDDHGWTPVYVAAMCGHAAVVETLHRLGSAALDRTSTSGQTPLHVAARYGHTAVVETLVRLGSALDLCQINGWTPVQLAAANGHATVVETLIRLGATTPVGALQAALMGDFVDVAELLLAAGASVSGVTDEQQLARLLATPVERLLAWRQRLYFHWTLLGVLLRECD